MLIPQTHQAACARLTGTYKGVWRTLTFSARGNSEFLWRTRRNPCTQRAGADVDAGGC